MLYIQYRSAKNQAGYVPPKMAEIGLIELTALIWDTVAQYRQFCLTWYFNLIPYLYC